MKDKEIDDQFKPVILNNIWMFRTMKGYSEEYVGQKIGITQSHYSKIEGGQTENLYKYLDAIAEVLDVHVFQLLVPNTNFKTGKGVSFPDKDYAQRFKEQNRLEINYNFLMEMDERNQKKIDELETEIGDLKRKMEIKSSQLSKANLKIKKLRERLEKVIML